jgi:hypothetical protein
MWWLFPRKAKAPGLKAGAREPEVLGKDAVGPQVVRRVEITVEREWTQTVVRKRTGGESGDREVSSPTSIDDAD